ncbi:MAG TPA: type II secretion system F family protein [Burkholderiales bacterium]|nr:type II secretion system F family protein [Burkholderiales bacterium]
MALYRYKAINPTGKPVLGQMDAMNAIDLELRLKRMGLDMVTGGPARHAEISRGIKRSDLINFCFHLEQLSSSGVPLIEGLTDLRDSVENTRLREVTSGLIESIQGGQNLSSAMSSYPQVFKTVFRSLVKAGEETGRLPDVLRSLTESLKWEDELAAQTKRIMIYPAIVGTVILGVTFFLMIYLVPQMMTFIRTMGQEIPLSTRILIVVSNAFVHYWWAIISVPAIAVAALIFSAKHNPLIRYRIDKIKLGLPLIGPILQKIILSRFASVFALMYSSGITIMDSIRSAEETAGNLVIQDGLQRAGQLIADGKNVATAFQEVGLFPPLVVRMLRVGEATGNLDTALLNVSYFYNREVREAIPRAQAVLEPAMTITLGLLMMWVMLSVLGPIYDTISKIKF